jgi:predicted RecA/RadA family phage recombinase
MTQATFVSLGNAIDYTPGSAVAAGHVVVQSTLPGFARTPIPANALGSLGVAGIYDIVKVTGAINAGVAVYWDVNGDPVGGTAGTGALTTTSTGNAYLGKTVRAAAESDATARVLVDHSVIGLQSTLTGAIPDPGDAGAIPVVQSGYVPIVTGGSETRTLAIPTFVGQELLLFIKTDGGTCVITVASAINQTGNNTITMADVNDSIRLHAIDNDGTLIWRVVCNDGAALSTV